MTGVQTCALPIFSANFDGVVKGVYIVPGDQVQEGTLLIEIAQEEGENDAA